MSEDTGWRPAATLENLRLRAAVLRRIRAFLEARGVLEVDTPALSRAATPDPALASFATRFHGPDGGELYLHTSPEYPMKRLLAAGSGPVWQLCKVFRDGEAGRLHNPEFTLLEWYRPGFDHHALMDEVEELVAAALGDRAPAAPAPRLTFQQLFLRFAGVAPDAPVAELAAAAAPAAPGRDLTGEPRRVLQDLLLTHVIEPRLPAGAVFVHDYPPEQAALARVRPGPPPVAERFELYLDGVELANGFHELSDPIEQRRRFEAELAARARRGLTPVPVDARLLAALESGLPDCAGVALGVDRLIMAAAGAASLAEVMAFPLDRA